MMYQELFVDEARWAMGQPDLETLKTYIGYVVRITLNHSDDVMFGHLTQVDEDIAMLDDMQAVPWRSIQSIDRM
jgi:hypothetical protein